MSEKISPLAETGPSTSGRKERVVDYGAMMVIGAMVLILSKMVLVQTFVF